MKGEKNYDLHYGNSYSCSIHVRDFYPRIGMELV